MPLPEAHAGVCVVNEGACERHQAHARLDPKHPEPI